MARYYSTQEALAPHHPPWTVRLTQKTPQSCCHLLLQEENKSLANALFHNLVDISHYNAYVLWTSIEPSWQQQKPYRRRLFIEEVGEMLVTPHIKKRGRLPRSSAAATMVSDLQGAAAGPSLISERKSRRQCHFCMDRRVCSTCCKCGKLICKDHSLSIFVK
ncbi:hypothetical protein KUCAC02_026966 [Chaenocephalus aceratus]|nr:hypothetical protein KUCAC02_026966 [Chaenocephalus aceratus]